MQINPHFLFNALNGIATLIHLDPRAADTMLGHLGELLRASLDDANAGEVPANTGFIRRFKRLTDAALHGEFSDSAHFSRMFRQTFGMTPSSVLKPLKTVTLLA